MPLTGRHVLGIGFSAAIAGLLAACGMAGPYPGVPELIDQKDLPVFRGPVAPPQVAYRIDENRYFEIVPLGAAACSNAVIDFVDHFKGIRSTVLSTKELGGVDLVIDAANDQYLVGPITRGNTDCSSGGGACGGSKLPYSTDGGKTWKRATTGAYGGFKVSMSGEQVYTSGMKARLSEVHRGPEAWVDGLLTEFPPPRKSPLTDKFHCTPNGRE